MTVSKAFGQSHWISGWQFDEPASFEEFRGIGAHLDREMRSEYRQKIAVPVTVRQKNGASDVDAFSRNMSGSGVCLLSGEQFERGSYCLLEMKRQYHESCDVVAECIWTKAVGESHWLSGWEFPKLDRIQNFHKQYWS